MERKSGLLAMSVTFLFRQESCGIGNVIIGIKFNHVLQLCLFFRGMCVVLLICIHVIWIKRIALTHLILITLCLVHIPFQILPFSLDWQFVTIPIRKVKSIILGRSGRLKQCFFSLHTITCFAYIYANINSGACVCTTCCHYIHEEL